MKMKLEKLYNQLNINSLHNEIWELNLAPDLSEVGWCKWTWTMEWEVGVGDGICGDTVFDFIGKFLVQWWKPETQSRRNW